MEYILMVFVMPVFTGAFFGCLLGFGTESVPLGVLLGIGFMAMIHWAAKTSYKQRKLAEEQAQTQLKIRFYNECVNNKIVDMNNKLQREKAELIAKRSGCKYSSIESYYEEAKIVTIGEAKAQEEAKLAQLRQQEILRQKELTRFSSYRGRNKRIAMLEEQRNYYNRQANLKLHAMEYLGNAVYTKEIDWATHAGIANGIAGGGAAVAVAMDIQKQNESIRARNRENLSAIAPAIVNISNDASFYEKEAKNCQRLIENAKIKLIEDKPSNEIMSYLSFTNKVISISDTGAVNIKVNVVLKKDFSDLKIGDAPAVVDGTIVADIYCNKTKVGSALMVLPTFGVRDRKATIEGMCLLEKLDAQYQVKFSPSNLWIMEA